MGEIVYHPAARLMAEVDSERQISSTAEAEALQNAIFDAVGAYYEYLEQNGLIYDAERDLMRASALQITQDALSCEIVLKDGPVDRRYGGGDDPDPEDRGLNPVWKGSRGTRQEQ